MDVEAGCWGHWKASALCPFQCAGCRGEVVGVQAPGLTASPRVWVQLDAGTALWPCVLEGSGYDPVSWEPEQPGHW